MESVLRAAAVYAFLLVVFRAGGKRALAQITPFDMVLLLIIAEAVQQALIGGDGSFTNAALVVVTLAGIDILLSALRHRWPWVEKLLDDVPVILVAHGRPLRDRLARARVDESDVLESARRLQGLERMDQIRYAVLETNGEITIVPSRGPALR